MALLCLHMNLSAALVCDFLFFLVLYSTFVTFDRRSKYVKISHINHFLSSATFFRASDTLNNL